jgi:hypothetical protein
MRFLKTTILIFLVVLLSLALFSPSVFASGGNAQGAPGSAPYGMAYSSNASGPKLYVTLSVYSYNTDDSDGIHVWANIKATLRVTRTNLPALVYYDDEFATGANKVDLNDIPAIERKLLDYWQTETDLIKDFFGDKSGYTKLVVKSSGDYVSYDDVYCPTPMCSFTIVDAILVAQ